MSILAQIGTKVGSEIKNLGIRMSSAETAIVNLGGQDPPPTGLTIAPVQWTNLTEIDLGDSWVIQQNPPSITIGDNVRFLVDKTWGNGDTTPQNSVVSVISVGTGTFQVYANNGIRNIQKSLEGSLFERVELVENKVVSGGSVQANGNGGIEKISGSNGYNAGASSTNFIEGNSNGYVQFQIAHATNSVKIGLVYFDGDYNVGTPYFVNIGGGGVDVFTPYIDNKTTYENGDWFRIRHYSQSNEIHFQKRQEIYGEDTEVDFIDGNANKGKFIFVNLVNFTSGKLYEITEVGVVGNGGIMVTDDIGGERWLWNDRVDKPDFIRGVGWQFTKSMGQDYVTFYTHPITTNGNNLYVDTSFHAVGSRLNDVLLAR